MDRYDKHRENYTCYVPYLTNNILWHVVFWVLETPRHARDGLSQLYCNPGPCVEWKNITENAFFNDQKPGLPSKDP